MGRICLPRINMHGSPPNLFRFVPLISRCSNVIGSRPLTRAPELLPCHHHPSATLSLQARIELRNGRCWIPSLAVIQSFSRSPSPYFPPNGTNSFSSVNRFVTSFKCLGLRTVSPSSFVPSSKSAVFTNIRNRSCSFETVQ